MSAEPAAPSKEVLQKLASSIALDIAHAPLKSKQHQRMSQLTKELLALEKSMMTTSDMITKAIARSEELTEEAANWKSISEEGGALATVLDQSMTRIAGVEKAATPVSSEHAHP